jgi:DNA-binding transcriptional ArsR family regulator
MSRLSDTAITRLTEIFRVLGDPTRVRILDALVDRERSVGDLANGLGVTQSAVSHQLRLLRGARIVRPRRAGRSVFYTLDDQHVVALYQEGLRHALEDRRSQSR